jgi:hypothetical protein
MDGTRICNNINEAEMEAAVFAGYKLTGGMLAEVPRISCVDNGPLRGRIFRSNRLIVHFMEGTNRMLAKDVMTGQYLGRTTTTPAEEELARKEIEEYEKTTMRQMYPYMAAQVFPPPPAYGQLALPAPAPQLALPAPAPQLALPVPAPVPALPAPAAVNNAVVPAPQAVVPYNPNQSSLGEFTIKTLVVVTAIVVMSCSLAVAYKIACQPQQQQPFIHYPQPQQDPMTMDKFFYFMNTWEQTKPKREEPAALPQLPPPPPPPSGRTAVKETLVDEVPVDSVFASWIWQAIALGIITVLYYLFVIPCWNAFTNDETPAARRKRYAEEARRSQPTTPRGGF